MRKLILAAFSLIIWPLVVAACTQPAQQEPQQPQKTPELKRSAPLPPALTTFSVARLEHEPGMGAPQNFGDAIALGENVLAVGAPDWNGMPGKQDGTVYTYEREDGGWFEQAQLFSSDRESSSQVDQRFGSAVALAGDWLFVGAPDADNPDDGVDSGAVYIFQESPDGWQQIQRLSADQPVANAGFGSHLAVSGDRLAVGENYQGDFVYIFQQKSESWSQQARLEIPQAADFERYLFSLALYGETLALGVQYRQGEGEQTLLFSRVLIYEPQEGGWEKIQELSYGEDTTAGWGEYAMAIALDGSRGQAGRLVVGTSSSHAGFAAGAVTVYQQGASGWEPSATLTAPDGKAIENFGSSLALDGDRLLVGAGAVSEDSFWDGVAYIFEYFEGRWIDQLRLTPPEDGGFGDFFGAHVAIYNDTCLVSAPNEFGNAVYVYEVGARPSQ